MKHGHIKQLLLKEELLAAYDLQIQSFSLLANKMWFEPLEKSFFETFDPRYQTVFGYYIDGTLAGIGILALPKNSTQSLSSQIGLDENKYLHVAHLEVIATNFAFRNQGIAKKLSQAIIKDAKLRGKKYLMSTVHPENISSIRVLKALGMGIVRTIKTYGSKDRHVMVMDL